MIKTKEDWIKAGFELLRRKGVSGIKIEGMARMLGVTKGGFYGYFLNREAFLQAMLDDWEKRHSTEILNSINNLTGNLSDKLQKLLYMIDDKRYDAIELSMYYWAAHDPRAQEVLMRVVRERLNWCTNLFLEGGFSQGEAEKRANIVHHFMAGCKSFRPLLPTNGSPERHEQLDHFLKQVTASVD
jgi:AcrR family transcriptional regulator